jgi:hypothetical protein
MTNPEDTVLATQFRQLLRRYAGATPEAFIDVLCPILIPIHSIDKRIFKQKGQSHYRATFAVAISEVNRQILCRGRTGKFVPSFFATAGAWREIAKGRFIDIDVAAGLATGEIYTGARKVDLEQALEQLTTDDLLEIDQYGAAAKVLSGLAEHSLVRQLLLQGYQVRRMPEDMARHLGSYPNYDFEVSKNNEARKVEVKSLWGTNTLFARLIHSTTSRPRGNPDEWTDEQRRNYYPTSSCKFSAQDIFAVSLFLRTGSIADFAFARSVPIDVHPHGLPRATEYFEHVNQNPLCEIGDGVWYASIDEVWNLP